MSKPLTIVPSIFSLANSRETSKVNLSSRNVSRQASGVLRSNRVSFDATRAHSNPGYPTRESSVPVLKKVSSASVLKKVSSVSALKKVSSEVFHFFSPRNFGLLKKPNLSYKKNPASAVPSKRNSPTLRSRVASEAKVESQFLDVESTNVNEQASGVLRSTRMSFDACRAYSNPSISIRKPSVSELKKASSVSVLKKVSSEGFHFFSPRNYGPLKKPNFSYRKNPASAVPSKLNSPTSGSRVASETKVKSQFLDVE